MWTILSGTAAAAESVVAVLPGQSLAEAVSRARAMTKPIRLELAGGRFELSEPLALTAADSGLTLTSQQGSSPVIAGSVRVLGWQLVDAARGLWQAEVPGVRDGRWRPRQLFVNGQRAQRARTPDNDFFHARGGLPQGRPLLFPAQAGTLKPEWASCGDAELVFYQKWIDARLVIKAIDPAAQTVTLNAQVAPWMGDAGCRYFIENTLDALTAPGEWYLDRSKGLLSYLAPAATDMKNAVITLPVAAGLISLKECSGITLRGLTFAETDYEMPEDGHMDPQAAATVRGMIRAEGCNDFTLEDCRILNAGGYGIEVGPGCHRWRISGNTLKHCGAGGIRVGDSGKANAPEGIAFSDNEIAHYGRIFPAGVGVLIMQSGKNRIAHNLIHDGYYTGISVGWTWGYEEGPCRENVIEFNHVHTIGQGLLSDMGGIYTLGPQPGTVIRGNWFHDIVSHSYGGWGLYTDEGSTGILLENNLVTHCKSSGFHQHYGKDNIVRNNVFAWNREHSLMRSREEAHNSFTFERNIVVADSGELMGSNWSNNHFVIDRNCYWDTRRGADAASYRFPGGNLEQWWGRGHDVHSIIQDPVVPAGGLPVPGAAAALAAIGFQLDQLPRADAIGPRPKAGRKGEWRGGVPWCTLWHG